MLSIVPVVSFGLVQANYTAVCWFSLSDKKMAMGFALTTIKRKTAFFHLSWFLEIPLCVRLKKGVDFRGTDQ